MAQPEYHGHVESAIPGRMRVRVHPTHRVLIPEIEAQLATEPGIGRVEARSRTGSIVVQYDRATTSHADVLGMLHAIGLPVQDRAMTEHKSEAPPKERKGSGRPKSADPFREDRGMIDKGRPAVGGLATVHRLLRRGHLRGRPRDDPAAARRLHRRGPLPQAAEAARLFAADPLHRGRLRGSGDTGWWRERERSQAGETGVGVELTPVVRREKMRSPTNCLGRPRSSGSAII